MRKDDRGLTLCARIYLLKYVQARFLSEKLFLLSPNDSKVPSLVTDLNLFLDADENPGKKWEVRILLL